MKTYHLKVALTVTFVIACDGNTPRPLRGSIDNVENQSSLELDIEPLRQEISRGRRTSETSYGSPDRLFGCGGRQLFAHSYGILIATDVFPDMDPTIHPVHNIYDIRNSKATANDLLVYYIDYCQLNPDDFPGKTLVVSGEAEYRFGYNSLPSPGERTYYLGPKADSLVSIRLPFAAMVLMTRSRLRAPKDMEMMKVIDEKQKVKNDLEHFLIYAASNCVGFREDAFDALSKIGVTHYAGSCHGSEEGIGDKKVPTPYEMDRDTGANRNFEIFPHYRYALVMENQIADGYISEKILNAFLGGTVPIWYGTREVFDFFNSAAFIYYDIEKPDEALNRIAYLEQNISEYEEMLNAPILAEGHRTVEKYLTFRSDYGNGSLGRRIRSMMGYESIMYHHSLLKEGEVGGGTKNVPRYDTEG